MFDVGGKLRVISKRAAKPNQGENKHENEYFLLSSAGSQKSLSVEIALVGDRHDDCVRTV